MGPDNFCQRQLNSERFRQTDIDPSSVAIDVANPELTHLLLVTQRKCHQISAQRFRPWSGPWALFPATREGAAGRRTDQPSAWETSQARGRCPFPRWRPQLPSYLPCPRRPQGNRRCLPRQLRSWPGSSQDNAIAPSSTMSAPGRTAAGPLPRL